MSKEKVHSPSDRWKDQLKWTETDINISEEPVQENEQRFQNLVNSSPSAIGILMGADFVITTANKAIIEIWGKGEEIIGKSYFEALPELAEQGYKEVFEEVYQIALRCCRQLLLYLKSVSERRTGAIK